LTQLAYLQHVLEAEGRGLEVLVYNLLGLTQNLIDQNHCVGAAADLLVEDVIEREVDEQVEGQVFLDQVSLHHENEQRVLDRVEQAILDLVVDHEGLRHRQHVDDECVRTVVRVYFEGPHVVLVKQIELVGCVFGFALGGLREHLDGFLQDENCEVDVAQLFDLATCRQASYHKMTSQDQLTVVEFESAREANDYCDCV